MNNSSSNPSDSSNLGNYGSETTSIDDFSVGGAELSRAQRLEENKKYKQTLLSNKSQFSSLDNSYTELEDGTIESNRNKIWNDLDDQEYQDLFNYTVKNQVLTPNEDGTASFSDGTPYQGRTRRLYMYGSKGEGNEAVKLGIARGDLDSSKLRYTPNEETGYGWESGNRGVDTNKEYLDILVPENVAKMIEGIGHGRNKALEGRAVKDLYTRTVEDKFPSFSNLQASEALKVPQQEELASQQESVEAAPKVEGLFGKALSAIADTRGWNPQDSSNLINFMGKVAEIESNGIVDRKQGDSEDGIGRGKYQFETSKGSGASKTAANRLFRGLPKLGIDVSEIPEADRAELSSDDPDFSKLSEDVQDLAFLVDKAEAGGVDLTAIAKGEISAGDAWLTTHWKGSEEEAPGKLAMWQERFGNEEPTPLGTDVVEAEVPVIPTTTEEDSFLANIKETLEAYKDFQDPFTREQLGSGSSEYYVNKEALFGKEGEYNEESGKKLFKQYIRDLDKKGRIQDVVDVEADRAARYQANRRWMAENANAVDQTLNTLQGFGATFVGELLVNPLDAIGDITGAYDLGTEEEKSEYLNEAFGYNPEAAAMAMEEIGKQWDIAANSELSAAERARAAGTGILEAFTTPEMLGTSLGALLAWVSPGKVFTMLGKGTKYADTVNRIDKLADAGKLTKQSARAKKVKAFASVDGAKSFLTKQSGFIASALGNVNNQYEEFVQNNNGVELTGVDKAKWFAGRFAIQMVNQNLDKFTDVSIIKNPGLITAIVPAIKGMTEKEFANVAKTIGKGVGKSVENMGKEAAQEYSQTMMELFNSRFGSAQFKNVEEFTDFITDERNTREAGIAALAGAGGSQQFEVVGSIGPAIGLTGQAVGSVVRRPSEDKAAVEAAEKDSFTPVVEDVEEVSEEVAAERNEAAATKTKEVINKYTNLMEDDEALNLLMTEDLEQEKAVDTSKFKEKLKEVTSDYRQSIDEIEEAEANIQDDSELKVLRRAKRELYTNLMEESEAPTLGSGYGPQDVVEDFLDTVEVKDNELQLTEAEERTLDAYVKTNKIPPLRFTALRSARIGSKDAATVYDDSLGRGETSASTYRRTLRSLVNTPNPDRKAIAKVIGAIDYFLNTQENREKAFYDVYSSVESDVKRFNASVKAGKPLTVAQLAERKRLKNGKDVAGYKGAFVSVSDSGGNTLKISDNSKAVLGSIRDTANYLKRTKARYGNKVNTILGSTAVGTGDTISVRANTKVQAARDKDAKFYESRKVNKAIINPDASSPQWKDKGDYAKDNASIVNVGDYTENDVIVVNSTAKTYKAGSKFTNQLAKAYKAGASIVIDREVASDRKLAAVLNRYNFRAVKVDGVTTYLPKEKAAPIRQKQAEVTASTRKENNIRRKLARAYDLEESLDGVSVAEALKQGLITARQKATYDNAIKDAKPLFDNDSRKMKAFYNTLVTKKSDALTETLIKIITTEGPSSVVYNEAKAQIENDAKEGKVAKSVAKRAIKAAEDEIAKFSRGENLLAEWKEAQDQAKTGEIDFKEWADANVIGPAKVAKDMLVNAIGKNKKKIYSYYDEKTKDFKVRTTESSMPEGSIYQVLEVDPTNYVEVTNVTPFNTLSPEDLLMAGKDKIAINKAINKAKMLMEEAIRKPSLEYKDKPGTTNNILDFANSPVASIAYNQDLELNDNVAITAHIAFKTFIKNNGYLLAKGKKTKKDLAEILGIDENQLSREAVALLADKGLLYKTAANSIGKDIASMLGLSRKSDSDADIQAYDALIADLGQTALLMGVAEGVLELDNTLQATEYAKTVLGKPKTVISDNNDAKVLFIQVKKGQEATVEAIAEEASKIADLVPGTDVSRKEPSFRPLIKRIKDKAVSKMRKEKLGLKIAESSKKAMNTLMNTEWSADLGLMRDYVENEELIKARLGYIEIGSDKYNELSFEEKETQASTNRAIEKSFSEMKWLVSKNEGDRQSLWFEYFFSKNGRFFIESNTINPQNDKHLHRFAVQPVAHLKNVTYKNGKFRVGTQDVTEEIHYSLAQAFGFATDKKDKAKIKAFAENILSTLNNKDAIATAKNDFLNDQDSQNLRIKLEHLGHAMQGFKFLDNLVSSKGKAFTSSLTAEFDAVTSGFGIKSLQMPIVGKIEEWLEKVGVLLNINPVIAKVKSVSMNNVLDEGEVKDSYQTLASEVQQLTFNNVLEELPEKTVVSDTDYSKNLWDALSNVLPKAAEDGTVDSKLRSLFKYPFMTFNYSASIKSIRKNLLTGELLTSIAKDMAKADLTKKDDPIVKLMEAFVDGNSTVKELQEKIRTEPMYKIKAGAKTRSSLQDYLGQMIEASYGAEVERILTDSFKPFVEAQSNVNNAFKAMFEVFAISFEKKLEEARKEGAVSKEKEKQIYEDLKAQWPMIKGPLSNMEEEINSGDGIGIYDTETATPYGVYGGRKPSRANLSAKLEKQLGQETVRVSQMIKKMSAAIAAGSVVPIHFIDGAIMAETINELGSEEGITSIHDAIMPSITAMAKAQQAYNKQTLEVNANYSFINEIVTSLDKFLDSVPLNDKAYVSRTVEVGKGKDTETLPVRDFLLKARNDVAALANDVNTTRADIYGKLNQGAKIMHMAGTAEGVYDVEAGSVDYKPIEKYMPREYNQEIKVDGLTLKDVIATGINMKCKG